MGQIGKGKVAWEKDNKIKPRSTRCCKITNYKSILKTICLTLSTIGFIYQTTLLFNVFFSGKTIVENRLERLSFSQIPAITICIPTFMSMDKYSEKYPELRDTYIEYKKAFENPKKGSNLKHYYKTFEKHFNAHNGTIQDTFGDISLDKLDMSYDWSTAFNRSIKVYELPKPVQFPSISPYHKLGKCFTLYSQLDANYRDHITQVRELQYEFKHNESWFPLDMYKDNLFIAIHSPNNMPEYREGENFRKLDLGYTYSIHYTEIQAKLLPPPYETNCKNYLDFNKTGEQYMRSDCVNECFMKAFVRATGLECISSYENDKLLRREGLFNLSKLPFCDCFRLKDDDKINDCVLAQYEVSQQCKIDCQNNCFEVFYDFEVVKLAPRAKEIFGFNVRHNQFLDQIIEHKPVMSVITLFSDFGGLLSLWLGLSIILIFDYILKVVRIS